MFRSVYCQDITEIYKIPWPGLIFLIYSTIYTVSSVWEHSTSTPSEILKVSTFYFFFYFYKIKVMHNIYFLHQFEVKTHLCIVGFFLSISHHLHTLKLQYLWGHVQCHKQILSYIQHQDNLLLIYHALRSRTQDMLLKRKITVHYFIMWVGIGPYH